jgi:hypothetical protein
VPEICVEPRIGRYVLLEELDRGATGVVYRALDPVISRTVAIKVLHVDPGLGQRQIESTRERFLREAQTAGNVDHPNVVRIFDVGEDEDGQAYAVMEHVSGPSLEKVLEERDLEPVEVANLLGQIASGLDAAHRRGIVHRDIKPANILMAEDGTPKIADFGIARVDVSHLTQDTRFLGTPRYMAPEQVEGKPLDGRSDLFSLGVLGYQLLTGRFPFEGDDAVSIAYQVVHSTPTPVSAVRAGMPRALDDVMARILAKAPSERFASGREFHEAFAACLTPPAAAASRRIAARTTATKIPGFRGIAVSGRLVAFAVVAVALVLFLLPRLGTATRSPRAAGPAPSGAISMRSSGERGAARVAAPAHPEARTVAPATRDSGGVHASPAGIRPVPVPSPRTDSVAASKPPRPRPKPQPAKTASNASTASVSVDTTAGSASEGTSASFGALDSAPLDGPGGSAGAFSLPPEPAPASTSTATISIASRMSRGTLTVLVDGSPILSDEFSKKKWMLYHVTEWSNLKVPSGRHQLTAEVKGPDGETYRSEPYAVGFEPGEERSLRISVKDGALVFKLK